jgi:7,8-dihydropterin-6-yl-methyl-4-(beta-D-ribofuranosyl)aminobenzene 5'-phosphate synthase
VRVTVLVDDEAERPGLRAAHGLALWIELADHRVLFDTGPGDVVLENADRIGIELAAADAIVLSHGHVDHSGGLAAVAHRAGGAAIFAGPKVTRRKYARKAEGLREIGLAHQTVNAVAHRLRIAEDDHRIVPGVRVLAQFASQFARPEDNKRLLVHGGAGMIQDPFSDEIALLVDTRAGPVLVTGCSHSGIRNVVSKAISRAGPIAGVIGGLHLRRERDEVVLDAADALAGIPRIVVGHCTGDAQIRLLRSRLGERVRRFRTGSVVDFS